MRNILNVANHLRQGYGGQDVEVLPVANHLRQGYGGQDVANCQEMRILCGTFSEASANEYCFTNRFVGRAGRDLAEKRCWCGITAQNLLNLGDYGRKQKKHTFLT